jgi:O-antigen/teichoic acid export membrane protein
MGYLRIAAIGASWIGALKIFSRGISILRTVILARILSPSQFGVFGIATLALSMIETLTETGINVVLVQKKESIEEYINTAWIISIARGFVIFLVIFLSAGFVSNFFKSKEAYQLLLLVSFVPLIRGFINPAIAKFQKELKFQKEFYYRLSILLVEAIISLILVIITKNTISLVWGLIGGAVFEVMISFIVVRPIPVLKFNKVIFREIISRSKWITSSGIFGYLFANGDNIVVGKALGTSSLGIYDMAYTIALLPTTELAEVVARVTFPVYVQFSEDKRRLMRAYIKTTSLIALITFPIVLLFFIFPTQLIHVFLGDKWLEAAGILQIMSIFAFIAAVFSPSGAVFYSVKKQKYNFIISVIAFFVMIIMIYPLVLNWGLIGYEINLSVYFPLSIT